MPSVDEPWPAAPAAAVAGVAAPVVVFDAVGLGFFAVAALLGGGVVVAGDALGWPNAVSAPLGALLAIGLRLASLRYRWNLPRG